MAGWRLGLGREPTAEVVALGDESGDLGILAGEALEADLLGGRGLEPGERLLRLLLLVLGREVAGRSGGSG